MAENKKSFVAYADWITQFNLLSDEEAGRLIKHIFAYVNDQDPELEYHERLLRMAFEPIKIQLKRDLKKYEDTKAERSNSGSVGNLKRWHVDLYDLYVKKQITLKEAQKIASDRNKSLCDNSNRTVSQTVANIADNDNVNVNVNVNVNDNVNDTDINNNLLDASAQKPLRKTFGKPEFKKYLMIEGADENHVDDWLKVREKKKAANTQTALDSFLSECKKNNFSVAEAVKICAENSWQGFKFSWVQNLSKSNQSGQKGNSKRGVSNIIDVFSKIKYHE